MPITQDDHNRIAAAIRAAEAQTSAEIVCVVSRASSNYAYVPIVWAALLALAAPWPLIAFTSVSVQRIYIAQLGVFALGALLLSPPRLRMMLVPRQLQRARAHHSAANQFIARGLAQTRERNGVLIFVSLAERYARIIADAGVASRAPQSVWRDAVNLLVAEVRHGRIGEGFVQAIATCGQVLATHFPRRDDDTDELPDRIYVI